MESWKGKVAPKHVILRSELDVRTALRRGKDTKRKREEKLERFKVYEV